MQMAWIHACVHRRYNVLQGAILAVHVFGKDMCLCGKCSLVHLKSRTCWGFYVL